MENEELRVPHPSIITMEETHFKNKKYEWSQEDDEILRELYVKKGLTQAAIVELISRTWGHINKQPVIDRLKYLGLDKERYSRLTDEIKQKIQKMYPVCESVKELAAEINIPKCIVIEYAKAENIRRPSYHYRKEYKEVDLKTKKDMALKKRKLAREKNKKKCVIFHDCFEQTDFGWEYHGTVSWTGLCNPDDIRDDRLRSNQFSDIMDEMEARALLNYHWLNYKHWCIADERPDGSLRIYREIEPKIKTSREEYSRIYNDYITKKHIKEEIYRNRHNIDPEERKKRNAEAYQRRKAKIAKEKRMRELEKQLTEKGVLK